MPDQDDGNGPELTAQIVQVLAEVADRGGLRAVPALDPEPLPPGSARRITAATGTIRSTAG